LAIVVVGVVLKPCFNVGKVVVYTLGMERHSIVYGNGRLSKQSVRQRQSSLFTAGLIRAGMRRVVVIGVALASPARLCVLEPVLLPFVLAPGVLSGKVFIADATDTVRGLLRWLASVLLADVAGAVAFVVASSELRVTVIARDDAPVRSLINASGVGTDGAFLFRRHSGSWLGVGNGGRLQRFVSDIGGLEVFGGIERIVVVVSGVVECGVEEVV
jgi:hypothetical protein